MQVCLDRRRLHTRSPQRDTLQVHHHEQDGIAPTDFAWVDATCYDFLSCWLPRRQKSSDFNQMPASQAQLNACLEVMRDAILQTRAWAWSGNVPVEQLADLMDAVHDIPTYMQHWDQFGADTIRDALNGYDRKWPKSVDDSTGLVDLFEKILNSNRSTG